MNELIQIVGFACLAYIVVDFISHFELTWLPNKPFRCDMCMAAWMSVGPLCAQFGLIGILYAAISGVLANLLYKYI